MGLERLAAERGLTDAAAGGNVASMTGREGKSWIDGPLPWLVWLPFHALPWLWRAPTGTELAASAVAVALFLPAYLIGYRLGGARLIAAAAVVLAISLALAPFGGNWTVFAIYASAMLGVLRPARRATVAIAGVAFAVAAAGLLLGQPLLWWLPGLLLVIMTGFATLSRETLYDRNAALLATQEEVRRLAGAAERERIARDLHDLVGRTLTLTALKADLSAKLVTRDVEAAEAEMREVARIAREGLGEVRAALAGMGGGGLAREAAASVQALEAAGVEARVAGDPAAIPADAGAVLAMTLREAVTNVIRHADAARCVVELGLDGGAARLEVADDGRGGFFREGNGLAGMRQRLAAAGGTLLIEANDGGTRLVASVPAAA